MEPCEKVSRGLCVLCAEEENGTNPSDTSDTQSVQETIQLQNQKSRQEEKRIFTDEYLTALEQCNLSSLVRSKPS